MTIKLRAMEPGDIDAIYRWENDPTVWTYSAAHQPFSRHALQQFIDESSMTDFYASRQLRLIAEEEGGHEPLGCVDLFDFDPFHRRAALGLLVDSRCRNRGMGRAILSAIDDFAQQHLCLHQLHCIIATDNAPCLTLFRSFGYSEAGILKQWIFQEGEWHDAIFFQRML